MPLSTASEKKNEDCCIIRTRVTRALPYLSCFPFLCKKEVMRFSLNFPFFSVFTSAVASLVCVFIVYVEYSSRMYSRRNKNKLSPETATIVGFRQVYKRI
jgi:hypothetical protein